MKKRTGPQLSAQGGWVTQSVNGPHQYVGIAADALMNRVG